MRANDPRSPRGLSVPPTLRYLRWQRTEILPNDSEIQSVRRILWIEVVLFALLPIFAAAMARGFGEYPFL